MLYCCVLFQVPLAPLQRGNGPPFLNQIWQPELHGTISQPAEQGIPVMITWSYGGNNVAVEGSWDNWTTRWDLMTPFISNGWLIVFDMKSFHNCKNYLMGSVQANCNYLQEGIAARWQGSLSSYSPAIRYISLQVRCWWWTEIYSRTSLCYWWDGACLQSSWCQCMNFLFILSFS